MSNKSLVELSEESKAKFASGEHHAAAKLLTEARERFKQAPGDRIDQGPDGTLCITTIETDSGGGQKIAKQVPVDRSSTEYRAEDYRDTSKDNLPAEVVDAAIEHEAQNGYGKVRTGPAVEIEEGEAATGDGTGEALTQIKE